MPIRIKLEETTTARQTYKRLKLHLSERFIDQVYKSLTDYEIDTETGEVIHYNSRYSYASKRGLLHSLSNLTVKASMEVQDEVQDLEQEIPRFYPDREENKSRSTSFTTTHNNILHVVPMEHFPLLSEWYNHDLSGRMNTMREDSRQIVHDILQKVPSHILKGILTTHPYSDVTIIRCVNSMTKHQTLYAIWKKNKDLPKSLNKDQWLETMGKVKDQRYHEVCWAVVTAELVSAVRYIKGADKVKTEYSIQDVVDFTNREQRGQLKSTGHYCYPWYVQSGLEYVSRCGIEREEARPFQLVCEKHVKPRIGANLGYIREAVALNTIEEALLVLLDHPVACSIPIFMPEYWEIGDDIYYEPTTPNSTFVGMHAVNIIGAGEENGGKYVLVRSSHGERIGKDGNFKVSIEITMLCLNPGSGDVFHPYPRPLLGAFTFPKLLSTGEENVRKKNEACPGSWIIDIDPPQKTDSSILVDESDHFKCKGT